MIKNELDLLRAKAHVKNLESLIKEFSAQKRDVKVFNLDRTWTKSKISDYEGGHR
jgi:hypothetical protein